jgi:hypothetical protein
VLLDLLVDSEQLFSDFVDLVSHLIFTVFVGSLLIRDFVLNSFASTFTLLHSSNLISFSLGEGSISGLGSRFLLSSKTIDDGVSNFSGKSDLIGNATFEFSLVFFLCDSHSFGFLLSSFLLSDSFRDHG